MKELRGYDIDGVLSKGIIPIEPYVVISGRHRKQWSKTIKLIGTNAPIYLRPSHDIPTGIWKGNMIKLLGVTEFYEDTKHQAIQIRKINPNVKIVKVSRKTQELGSFTF